MKIDVLWSGVEILRVEYVNEVYVSTVYTDNIEQVKRNGFPLFFLKEINVVSNELPALIKKRLSSIGVIKNKLKLNEKYPQEEFEEDIKRYVETTGCARPTDKFTLKIII